MPENKQIYYIFFESPNRILIYNVGVPIRVPELQDRAARNVQFVHILLDDYFFFNHKVLCFHVSCTITIRMCGSLTVIWFLYNVQSCESNG